MSRIYVRKPKKISRRRKYGRGRPYMRNNKVYFGGKIHRGRGIGQVVKGLLSNLVRGVLGGICK